MVNAFNTLTRAAMLEGAQGTIPGAYNWLRFCYDQPTWLICGGQRFCQSRTGVHQGDAMGPLGFAVGLKIVTDRAPVLNLLWKSWSLDDGTIVGPAKEVYASLAYLTKALPGVDLQLNLNKCLLFGPGVRTNGETSFPDDLRMDHPARGIPAVPFAVGHGISSLGLPVDAPGSTAMASKFWDSAVGKTYTLLERMRQYPEAQIRHCLLRYCLDACRVMFLLRGCGIAGSEVHVERLSEKICEAADDLVRGGLTDDAWAQVTMPIRLGGFGISDPIAAWPAARTAAIVGLRRHGHRVGLPPAACQHVPPDWTLATDLLQGQIGPEFEPLKNWRAGTRSLDTADQSHTTQKWWADQVSKVLANRLPEGRTARDQIRLASQTSQRIWPLNCLSEFRRVHSEA